MTTSASQILHAHAGSPPFDGCAVAPCSCWVCGASSERGKPRTEWQGSNFVGQNRARSPSSELICEACVWAMAGKPPDTLRMYSHLYEEDGEYLHVNKGQKPAMRAFLRRSHSAPWFAAIADSGQKHIVPWTPVNPAGSRGRVLFEETIVALPGPDGWLMLDEIAALLTAGATKEEMSTARYSARAWQLCGEQLRAFEREHGGKRGGPWFELALWLAQRDEAAVEDRMKIEAATRADKKAADKARTKEASGGKTGRRRVGKVAHENGGAAAGDPASVPVERSESAQTLGPDPVEDVVCCTPSVEPGRVVDDAPQGPSIASAVQLGLPGLGGPGGRRSRTKR